MEKTLVIRSPGLIALGLAQEWPSSFRPSSNALKLKAVTMCQLFVIKICQMVSQLDEDLVSHAAIKRYDNSAEKIREESSFFNYIQGVSEKI